MTTIKTPDYLDNSLRNVIINGNFDFWQRNTSFPAIANDTYSADRWTNNLVGTMVQTFSRSTDVPTYADSGFKSLYSFLVSTTTAQPSLGANDFRGIKYHVEGQDLVNIFGGIVTLSFWVKAFKTGIYSVYFQDAAGTRGWVTSFTVNASSTWEKKFVSINLTDSTGASFSFDNILGLKILIVLAAGSNHVGGTAAWTTGNVTTFAVSGQVNGVDSTSNTFQLAQVMFNKGSVPAPFARAGLTAAQEFGLCLRYYYKFIPSAANHAICFGYAVGAAVARATHFFPAVMRQTPSFSYSANGDFTNIQADSPTGTVTGIGQDAGDPNKSDLGWSTSGGMTTGQGIRLVTANTNSYMVWDSEL